MAMTGMNGTLGNEGSLVESGYFGDASDSGNLGHLNSLLVKYIKMVQQLEGQQDEVDGMPTNRTTINVTINRSKLTVLVEKYDKKINEWIAKCKSSDDQIAALLAKIAELEAAIKHLTKNNSDKESTIRDKDLMIVKLTAEISRLEVNLKLAQQQKEIFDKQLQGLRSEIAKTTADLKLAVTAYSDEKKIGSKLAAELRVLEKELRFKIAVLGSEIETENKSVHFDTSSVASKIKESYQIKMDGQLVKLREMYEKHTHACTLDLENIYKSKISVLETDIVKIPKPIENNEDIQNLQIKLETSRLKASELETNNLDLNNKQISLDAANREREQYFKEQESAKDRELKMLQEETEEIKRKFEKLMKEMDWEQVKNYSTILTPEIRRISSAGMIGSQGKLSVSQRKKTLNFSHSESISGLTIKEMGSSSSDSENDNVFASNVTSTPKFGVSTISAANVTHAAKGGVASASAASMSQGVSSSTVVASTDASKNANIKGGVTTASAANVTHATNLTQGVSSSTVVASADANKNVNIKEASETKIETIQSKVSGMSSVQQTVQTSSVTSKKETTSIKQVSQTSSKKSAKKN